MTLYHTARFLQHFYTNKSELNYTNRERPISTFEWLHKFYDKSHLYKPELCPGIHTTPTGGVFQKVISNARLCTWNIPLMFQGSFSLWHLPCLCVYLETWLVLKEQKLFYLLEQLSKPPKSNQIRSGSSCQQCNASQLKNATVQIGVHAIWTPAGQSSPSWQSYLVVFKEMD